jgi:hypothetical protein
MVGRQTFFHLAWLASWRGWIQEDSVDYSSPFRQEQRFDCTMMLPLVLGTAALHQH